MKRIAAILALALPLTALLSACAPNANTPETTEAPQMKNIYQKEDPAKDDTMNILMIGNSHCYYYADELVGLATANGLKVRVSNVYASGCIIRQHYQWWKEGQANYKFITHDENGKTVVENASLDYCLQQANWDAISLQSGTADFAAKPAEEILDETRQMRKELWAHIKTNFPKSAYYWHHSWSFQLGADKSGVLYDEPSKQHALDENLAALAKQVCAEDQVLPIPTGPAWRRVRDGGYDNLCARIGHPDDRGHDGDIGGGQYLNACVWFERLLGESCIGNTFRPDYELSEDLIQTLQKAAHDTVAALAEEEKGQ